MDFKEINTRIKQFTLYKQYNWFHNIVYIYYNIEQTKLKSIIKNLLDN
jgi:hypothetical protein